MYCNKCGKWIDYDASTCVECQEAELQKAYIIRELYNNQTAVTSQTTAQQPIQQNATGSKKAGLAYAIVSLITGSTLFPTFFMLNFLPVSSGAHLLTIGLVMGQILGFVFGILSIKCFKRQKRLGYEKPVATFVLGLIGLILNSIMVAILALSLTITILLLF